VSREERKKVGGKKSIRGIRNGLGVGKKAVVRGDGWKGEEGIGTRK